jgi:hypothetical protein
MSTADLALITALCVLATGKRSTIQHLLLDRASFRSSVDDSQLWILDAIRGFVNAQYGETLMLFQRHEVSQSERGDFGMIEESRLGCISLTGVPSAILVYGHVWRAQGRKDTRPEREFGVYPIVQITV